MSNDIYKNFAALKKARPAADYTIEHEVGAHPEVLIMAPHGGGIEPGTTPVARRIAGADYSFYTFQGNLPIGNAALHITSSHFDEPTAVSAVTGADIAVALHGAKGTDRYVVYPGGLDNVTRDIIAQHLFTNGFALETPPPELAGVNPLNIVNRTRRNGGVQLEISRALRDKMKAEQEVRTVFVNAVRRALAATLLIIK